MNSIKKISMAEFVILMASLVALGAMSTDAMLPALQQIGADLGVKDANGAQFIIYAIFGGFAIGQIFYGPLSDSIGRKKSIYISLGIFIFGSFVSMISDNYITMLIGRFLQGFGASGPKIVTMALIRDRYKGREMAKIMSFIAIVFVFVPALAPIIGGFILSFGDWHYIFLMFILSSSISFVWFATRQDETLNPKNQKPLNLNIVLKDTLIVLKNRKTMLSTVILGAMFGVFMSYLSTAEQIFSVGYGLGENFTIYFAINALTSGFASFANAKLVGRFGMRELTKTALIALICICAIFLVVVFSTDGHPALWVFMVLCMSCFFCFGIIFGNLNALAMEPMGEIAGTAAAFIGSFSTIIALPIGILIGQFYSGTVTPFALGFSISGVVSLILFLQIQKD